MDSPLSGTTGIFKVRSMASAYVLITCPTVIEVFRESISISFGLRFWTGSCFPVPRTSLNSVYFIVIFSVISGREFSVDAIDPDIASAFVRVGSSSVSIARDPPGNACVIWWSPFCMEMILDFIVL